MSTDLQPFGGSSFLPFGQLGRGAAKEVKRSTDLVVGLGEVAHVTDTVRAGLTYGAMQNAGALAGLAVGIVEMTPQAAPTCEALLTAYGVRAANMVARFG